MKQVLACFAVMTALGCSAASPSTTILQPPSSVVAATPSATPGTIGIRALTGCVDGFDKPVRGRRSA